MTNQNDFLLSHNSDLGGGSSSDSTPELSIPIPEELQGQDIDIKAIDNDTKLEASWVTGLTVNDSNNTVTGTVSKNTGGARSCTITLTNGGKSNLSLASPYSFTLSQQANSQTYYLDADVTYYGNYIPHLGIILTTNDGNKSMTLTISGSSTIHELFTSTLTSLTVSSVRFTGYQYSTNVSNWRYSGTIEGKSYVVTNSSPTTTITLNKTMQAGSKLNMTCTVS